MDEILRRLLYLFQNYLVEPMDIQQVKLMSQGEFISDFNVEMIPAVCISGSGEKSNPSEIAGTRKVDYEVLIKIIYFSTEPNYVTIGEKNIYNCSDYILDLISTDKGLYDLEELKKNPTMDYCKTNWIDQTLQWTAQDYDLFDEKPKYVLVGKVRDLTISFMRLRKWESNINPDANITAQDFTSQINLD